MFILCKPTYARTYTKKNRMYNAKRSLANKSTGNHSNAIILESLYFLGSQICALLGEVAHRSFVKSPQSSLAD